MCSDRVTAVTVAYNSGHAVAGCLESVRGCALVVVDNASQDDTQAIVRERFPEARIVANAVNEGFGRANNRGCALANTEYVLFINPDARLTPGSLDKLLEAARRHPEAALIAPRILRPGGRVEISHDVDLWRRGDMPPGPAPEPEGEICADFLSGAVILLRRSALKGYPPFDPALFLYYEDDDLCLRLRREGHALIQVPEAVAEHVGGGASRPSWRITWRKFWHMAWSRLYLEEKYFGAAAATMTGVAHLLRFGPKAIGYALILNHKKALRDAARYAGTFAYLVGVKAIR